MENQKGFTLIEVLLIVVILGIIAAIVIPRLMMASIEAEATKNLTEIGRLQESYKIATGSFLSCPKYPENVQQAGAWQGNEAFEKLGFSPIEEDNKKKLQYEVVLTGTDAEPGYKITAVYSNTTAWCLKSVDGIIVQQ